jgi:hypothetical protein
VPIASIAPKLGGTIEIRRRTYAPDPRGEGYGYQWTTDPTPIPAASRKLKASERFHQGREYTAQSLQIFVDLLSDGSSPITEKNRIEHPDPVRPGQTVEVNIASVVPYVQPKYRFAIIEGEYEE